MTLLETIERLYEITCLQAEIIKRQAEVIEQAKISDAVAEELSGIRKKAAQSLALIEK